MTASEMGRKGGKVSAANLTSEERTARARKAARKRWGKKRKKPKKDASDG